MPYFCKIEFNKISYLTPINLRLGPYVRADIGLCSLGTPSTYSVACMAKIIVLGCAYRGSNWVITTAH